MDTHGVDNPEEDSSAEFEGLHEKLTREPVSLDQADARVYAVVLRALQNKRLPTQLTVDQSLPPETVVKMEGTTITLSRDAYEALLRHEDRTGTIPFIHGRKAKRVGIPYRGS